MILRPSHAIGGAIRVRKITTSHNLYQSRPRANPTWSELAAPPLTVDCMLRVKAKHRTA